MSAAPFIKSFRTPLAAFLAALVLLVTGLVHLPEAHRALHPSAPDPEHCASHEEPGNSAYPLSSDDLCVVALFAQGLDAPWQAALIALPACVHQDAQPVRDAAPALNGPAWRHPPAQAPPALATVLA